MKHLTVSVSMLRRCGEGIMAMVACLFYDITSVRFTNVSTGVVLFLVQQEQCNTHMEGMLPTVYDLCLHAAARSMQQTLQLLPCLARPCYVCERGSVLMLSL